MQVRLETEEDGEVVINDVVTVKRRSSLFNTESDTNQIVVYFEEVRDVSRHITDDIDAETYENAEILSATEIPRKYGVVYCHDCETEFEQKTIEEGGFVDDATGDVGCPECGSHNYEAAPALSEIK